MLGFSWAFFNDIDVEWTFLGIDDFDFTQYVYFFRHVIVSISVECHWLGLVLS